MTGKPGRNDPCPCGSGKKYKRCCLGTESPRQAASSKSPAEEMALRFAPALEGGLTESAAAEVANAAAEDLARLLATCWQLEPTSAACGKGCSYCCRGMRVAVTIPELARLVAWTRTHLAGAELSRVTGNAEQNAPRTHASTIAAYPSRLPCALLAGDGSCSAYAARPLMCQKEHSLDVAPCREAVETNDPAEDIQIPHALGVLRLGDTAFEVYRGAMREVGLDARLYELQEALHIALTVPDAFTRWLSGDNAFASALLNESPEPGYPRAPLVPLRLKGGG